eukprot:ctg_795.g312
MSASRRLHREYTPRTEWPTSREAAEISAATRGRGRAHGVRSGGVVGRAIDAIGERKDGKVVGGMAGSESDRNDESTSALLDRDRFYAAHPWLRELQRGSAAAPPEWFAALYQVYADLRYVRGWREVQVECLDREAFPEGILGPLGGRAEIGESAVVDAGERSETYWVYTYLAGTPPGRKSDVEASSDAVDEPRPPQRRAEVVLPIPIHVALSLHNLTWAVRVAATCGAPDQDAVGEDAEEGGALVLAFVDSDTTTAYYRIMGGLKRILAEG